MNKEDTKCAHLFWYFTKTQVVFRLMVKSLGKTVCWRAHGISKDDSHEQTFELKIVSEWARQMRKKPTFNLLFGSASDGILFFSPKKNSAIAIPSAYGD